MAGVDPHGLARGQVYVGPSGPLVNHLWSPNTHRACDVVHTLPLWLGPSSPLSFNIPGL